MQARAASRRSTSSRPTSRRSASSRSSRSTRTTRTRYFAPRALLPQARQWLELINAYERHICGDARSPDEGRALRRDRRRSTPTRSRTPIARSTPTATSSTSTTRTSPRSKRSRKLYDKQGDAAQAIDYMTRVAELTQDSKQRVEIVLPHRQGARREARRPRLRRRSASRWRSISIRRTCRRSRRSARSRIDNADYDKAARYLDQEQSYTPAPRQRARLLVELGKLREEMLGEHDAGRPGLRAAHRRADARERGRGAAARRRVHRAPSSWAKAEPLARHARPQGGQARARRAAHAPQQARQGARRRSARTRRRSRPTQAAHQLDLTDQETIRGLADVSFRLKDWAGALTNYQKVLTSLGEDETEERADVYYQARLHQARAGPGQAGDQQLREGARRRRRAPPDARSAGRRLRRAQGLEAGRRVQAPDPRQRRRRRGALQDARSRSRDIWADKDKNPPKAIEALEEARDLQPAESRRCSTSCSQLYQRPQNWAKMIDTIQAHRRDGEGAGAQEQVHLHDGAALSRQG